MSKDTEDSLINIAASLLQCCLSPDKDGYTFDAPKYHLRAIKNQNDLIKNLAVRLIDYHKENLERKDKE